MSKLLTDAIYSREARTMTHSRDVPACSMSLPYSEIRPMGNLSRWEVVM
jgi:hypothetical protein